IPPLNMVGYLLWKCSSHRFELFVTNVHYTTCLLSSFIPCCVTDDGVISVQTALYGRADAVTCSEGRPPAQLANKNCSQAGTVDVIKKRCDGKRECELNINVFYTSDPCYGTYKYLETTYTCLPASESHCHMSVIFVYGADYGRRDQTTCIYQRPPNQVQNIYCSSLFSLMSLCIHSCNGKNNCTIAASNSVFGDPCVGTYKYLEVASTCYCKYLKGPFGCSLWDSHKKILTAMTQILNYQLLKLSELNISCSFAEPGTSLLP
uniref:SUEL-type lectin domain-containing protein n=1 Tax=Sander lucioperca TaxID=283035 RepID=A0A8C9X9P8_SANLU